MDPLSDLEREVAALRADLDAGRRVDEVRFERIESDIERIREDHKTAVARSWALVMLVLTAAAGGLVALVTRQP